MNLRQGNMFDQRKEYDILFVTTNARIRKDGALVMGRGAALTATDIWPLLPYALGKAIKGYPYYGIVIPGSLANGPRVGAFQVKLDWRDPADKDLIFLSTTKLNIFASAIPDSKIALNFPGIGNGKLARDIVLPIIQTLPENVDVWEL